MDGLATGRSREFQQMERSAADKLHEAGEVAAVLLGINGRSCADRSLHKFCDSVYHRVCDAASRYHDVCEQTATRYGASVRQRHLAVAGLDLLSLGFSHEDFKHIAKSLDGACAQTRADAIGGFGIDVRLGPEDADAFFRGIPAALQETTRVCGTILAGDLTVGLNWKSLNAAVEAIRTTSEVSPIAASQMSIGVGTMAWSARPYALMAPGGVSERVVVTRPAPAPVLAAVTHGVQQGSTLEQLGELVRSASFRTARSAVFFGQTVATELGATFVGIDPVLKPSRRIENSVAAIIKLLGVAQFGAAGTAVAVMWLRDQWSRGVQMATNNTVGTPSVILSPGLDLTLDAEIQAGKLNSDRLCALAMMPAVHLSLLAVPHRSEASAVTACLGDLLTRAVDRKENKWIRLVTPAVYPGHQISLGQLGGETTVLALGGADQSSDFVKNLLEG